MDEAELAARQPHILTSARRAGTGREMFGALREKLWRGAGRNLHHF